MNRVYLGLGSNLGDRRNHLNVALSLLQEVLPSQKLKVSPVYETPALLPDAADPEWNKAYLNLVAMGMSDDKPHELLRALKNIEKKLGRLETKRWGPRTIDIDILNFENNNLASEPLSIPHPELENRAFVLDPLKDLDSCYSILARNHPQHSPLWMAILNVTPDSFSDGGAYVSLDQIESYLSEIETQTHMIDVGAESTRPGATPLTWQEEWNRLEGVLKFIRSRYSNQWLKPKISVDTRHGEVAQRSLELGVDIINDVGGFKDPAMREVIKESSCQYVLMHSLSVPADKDLVIPPSENAATFVAQFFERKILELESVGISSERVILDPGIGFGKNSLQSLDILRGIETFRRFSAPLLVGHSRKSFIGGSNLEKDRDLESIGISLNLAKRGADILRVHNPLAHIRAFQGFNSVLRTI